MRSRSCQHVARRLGGRRLRPGCRVRALLARFPAAMWTTVHGNRNPQGYECRQVLRTEANRVVDPNVWQLAGLADLVDPPSPDAEHLRRLGNSKQPFATAPQ